MDAAPAGDQLVPPAEADWPPELRLPAPPPPAPAGPQPPGMDDSQFLGAIMGEAARQGPADHQGAALVLPKKRGRPPKKRDGAALVAAPARPAKRREDEEEVVCFICFDGGNLVVCDRRGCPKVYHPACIKRDESFFNARTKWNCGWHICSSCEKAAHYMCYTCTYSLCKMCIKHGKFFSVRGAKGFCDTCFGTILLIESKDEAATKLQVDFDDINSWEYLFKLYWLDLKGKLSLTLEELTSAKSRWTVPNTCSRKEKEESSDDLYDISNEGDGGSDYSSRKRRRTNSSRKKGGKRQKLNLDCSIAPKMVEPAINDAGSVAEKVPTNGVSLLLDTKWASPELLEFVGHVRDGDQSVMSQFDVQTLLLEYIKKNNLRDPKRTSQIICDARLHRLFRKKRVAHFEMLKLLEMQFPVNETSTVTDSSQVAIDLNSTQIDNNGFGDMEAKPSPDKRRKMNRKMEREPQVNPGAYAAVDMHNINLIYMRRSLMEELIDDVTFLEKIYGAFVRIKISGVGQKQDMYRLVKVVGTHKVPEKYNIGKKTTNFALEILNLDKKEIITMDTISNQDFTEEECNRLRQSMKCGIISRLKVGAVQEKAKVLQSVRVNDWLENEKQRLGHLRDRASETGRKKELRECVEKLQLLNDSEERTRRINEAVEVHVDPHMDPNYESAEEIIDKKSVETNVNRTRADTSVSRRKSKFLNSAQNPIQKITGANNHPKNLSTESTMRGLRTGRKLENFHHTNGTDLPTPSPMCEAGSVASSVLTMASETEPEKVWHYKDPSGNVQGPFTLLQLSKWTTYFPRDLRVWLTFESEERSLLLTEVLSKQHTVFNQTTSVTTGTKATSAGMEVNKNSPSVDQINALSPTGCSMLNSSVVTVQSNKYSVPKRESVNSPEDCLSLSTSSVQPKDVHTLNSQVQCQTKHSIFVQSPGSPYGLTDLHHDGANRGCYGESNHRHSSAVLSSSITVQMNCNEKSNVVSHHQNQHTSWLENQGDFKNSSQGVSVKDLSKNLPTRVGKDAPSPVFAWSPSESRTASSQHDGSCISSTTNPSFFDEHHSSIASAKPKSCAPATPVEDRGSSSPSGMSSHSERVPISIPRSAPSASASDMCKIEENMSEQITVEADMSNASVNQSPESKVFSVSSPDNQDIDHEFPSPTPRHENKEPVADNSPTPRPENKEPVADNSPTPRPENKEPVVDNSGLTPASPEKLGNTCSPVSSPCKMEEIVNQPKMLEADASNAQSEVLHVSSSNNEDLERESQCPTTRSDNKEPAADNSLLTSAATESLWATSASDTGTCKMEATVNHQKPLEEDASGASLSRPPHSNALPISSTDNQDIDHVNLSPRTGSKELSLDNSGLKPAAPENLSTCTASASNACKMEEILDKKKTFETDASDGPVTLPSKVSPVSSPTSRSDNKEPPVDSSFLTSAATESLRMASASDTDTCKMDATVNQQKTPEENASDASLSQPPHSNAFPVSSTVNQDIELANLSPRSGNKEPIVDNSGLKSGAPENLSTATTSASNACSMVKILDKKITVETDASDDSITLPSKVSLVSSPDNMDTEHEFPCPAKSESMKPLVDNSVLASAAPENVTTFSASASDRCKTEMLDKKAALETDASNGSVTPSAGSKDFLVTSDNHDSQCEYPSSAPRTQQNEEPDTSKLQLAEPENLTTKAPDDSRDASALPNSGPLTGKLYDMESEFKGVEEIIRTELYSESTVATRENVVIDPSCGAESIDVSDVLESLMEQKCETSYMHGTTALDDLLAASAEEEPQCSSPIALSPWGEPSYYQSDAVDSALWGVQDDPINDMWSLLSPTPSLQPSSGLVTEASETLDIDDVAVAHGISEFFQRGPLLGEKNMKQAISGAVRDWVLPEQVKSIPNDVSVSSVAGSSGIVGWQLPASQGLSAGTASGTSQAPRKQESTDSSVSSSREVNGNTNKSWNPPSVNVSKGNQKNHRRGKYSEISESWLLSSNNSRSRSDRFGNGVSSRSTSNGQARGVCKFHEGGYCRKGASCSYLHL